MMDKEQMLEELYLAIVDDLEEYDDFVKMYELIEQMSKINADKAFDMWYPLLKKYENFVVGYEQGITAHLTSLCMEALGEAKGYIEFDEKIVEDDYLYDLLFRKYCEAGSWTDYTHKMIIRAMISGKIKFADDMFADIFDNGNKADSWYEIMDGFIKDIGLKYEVNQKIVDLLSKWGTKISNKKEKAKFLSGIIATGFKTDLSLDNGSSGNNNSDFRKRIDINELNEPLRCMLSQYSNAINDRQILKALLADFYPNNKLYTNILLMVYDEGLVNEIDTADNVNYFMLQRMSSRLVNNYGIGDIIAISAIEAWVNALK